jgi:hypothetical protein
MEVAVGAALFGGVATYWIAVLRKATRHERSVLKEHTRANRAHYAAVEAAEDDPTFSPDVIRQSVADIIASASGWWRSGTLGALEGRRDASLIRAWARTWQSRIGRDLEAVGLPSIDLLSVVNRDDEEEDRVAVRVRVRIHCKHPKVGTFTHHLHIDERWTFERSDRSWFLLSMGGDPLASLVLTSPLIANPAADTDRLREESFSDMADAQKVGDDVDLSDLVSPDEAPTLALLDLSLVDGRFLPALIATELAHLIEAWEGAVSGSEAPLAELASTEARDALLRPGPNRRLVVHDAVLKSWEATRLDLSGRPPAIEVALVVEATRSVVRDDGRAVVGNQTEARQLALTWTLELTDSAQDPWRLATSNNPAESIAGWPS